MHGTLLHIFEYMDGWVDIESEIIFPLECGIFHITVQFVAACHRHGWLPVIRVIPNQQIVPSLYA